MMKLTFTLMEPALKAEAFEANVRRVAKDRRFPVHVLPRVANALSKQLRYSGFLNCHIDPDAFTTAVLAERRRINVRF